MDRRLRVEAAGKFPEKVTAFREGMAAHGRYGEPCPVCGAKIQRIRYADRETNYCAKCQTGGKLLADRGLSRLLKEDWPRTLEEMEERKVQTISLAPDGSEADTNYRVAEPFFKSAGQFVTSVRPESLRICTLTAKRFPSGAIS